MNPYKAGIETQMNKVIAGMLVIGFFLNGCARGHTVLRLMDNVIMVFKGDNQTMKASQGRVFTDDGEFNDDGDLPDGAYDCERMYF